ncbi:MAG TPA: heme o synthase [Candidatus Thermoplasmatota archaeon]|nr:heme o synthase [Candidatus Thermoplasmatota archaeon]
MAAQLAKDLYAISKPRILFLLLLVAYAAMFVAAGGWPSGKATLAVTLGGAASTAASGAFNHVLERERDARMPRTKDRPVASGRLGVPAALAYATVMSVLALVPFALLGLWAAAALTAGAIAYYVVVYTVLLKPTTPQNIVIGGLAGSFPALIGWSAQAGGIGMPAVVLAALVFLWTPAHFWALALFLRDDYGAGGYPMLPNVKGEAYTRRAILVYSILTLLCSLSLLLVVRDAWLYLAIAVVLGTMLVLRAVRLLRPHAPAADKAFFLFTIQYLGFLLLALMADRVVVRLAGT